MSDLFVEIFPIEPDKIPALAAYTLSVDADFDSAQLNRIGARFARQLSKTYPGVWLWADDHIVTDDERNAVELMITADMLKSQRPEQYAAIQAIQQDIRWQAPPEVIADFVIRSHLLALHPQFQTALEKMNTRLRNAVVEREHKLQAWAIGDQPAVSISIASRMIYGQTIAHFVAGETDQSAVKDRLVGLWAIEKISGVRGEIVGVAGTLSQFRKRLLDRTRNDEMRELLTHAPDDEWVITVRTGKDDREFIASALRLIVRFSHLNRFDVDAQQATLALQMRPSERAQYVRAISDIAKSAGVLSNAFNSRTTPDQFLTADFDMNLRFAGERVRQYSAETLAYDFSKLGAYKMRKAFKKEPIKICVVNTLPFKLSDFVEAMRRLLEHEFDFSIEVIRERQVRVVSRSNLESAVRVVEKENPDITLIFFPDEVEANDDDDGDAEATASYIRSLTLGRGIPSHVITETILNDPDSMPIILMGILGKTGNSPFVLSEPLENTDFVVGLDIVRQSQSATGDIKLTAIARVYKSDGEFLHYKVCEVTLTEDKLPFVLTRDLFSQKEFAGKRVVIHHDGKFPDDLRSALSVWAQAIKAIFYPVEIMRFGAPRIYAIGDRGVTQPPWGSAFTLSDCEALLISSLPKDDLTPQPLHIRTIDMGHGFLPIEKALRGALVWTLLAYGALGLTKLPVTIINTDQLTYWLSKGGAFGSIEGESPFWL
jgi:hypothetical protein